jgi:hypothetical protein
MGVAYPDRTMSDAQAGKFHTETKDGHYHASEHTGHVIQKQKERVKEADKTSPAKQKMSLQMYKALPPGYDSEADWRSDLKEGKTYRERKLSRKWGRAEDLTKDREKAEEFAKGIDTKHAPKRNVRRSAKNIARLRKKEAMAEIKAKRYSGRPDRAKGEERSIGGMGYQRKRARKARKAARREFRQEKRNIRRTGGYDTIKELQND